MWEPDHRGNFFFGAPFHLYAVTDNTVDFDVKPNKIKLKQTQIWRGISVKIIDFSDRWIRF